MVTRLLKKIKIPGLYSLHTGSESLGRDPVISILTSSSHESHVPQIANYPQSISE